VATLFSKIVSGEIPCHKIAEDAHHLAFLDINPLKAGHTLVIPKKEVDYIFDMEDTDLANLMVFSKKVAIALKSVIPCKKVGVSVIGLEVPHTHIHLVPIDQVAEINFAAPKLKLSQEEMTTLSQKVSQAFQY